MRKNRSSRDKSLKLMALTFSFATTLDNIRHYLSCLSVNKNSKVQLPLTMHKSLVCKPLVYKYGIIHGLAYTMEACRWTSLGLYMG